MSSQSIETMLITCRRVLTLVCVALLGSGIVACGKAPESEETTQAAAPPGVLKTVRLVPYSAAISHPRSKPRPEIESANRTKFQQAFQADEVVVTLRCVYNAKGYFSSSSVEAVAPEGLYPMIRGELSGTTSLPSDICGELTSSATFKNSGVSVSIIEQ